MIQIMGIDREVYTAGCDEAGRGCLAGPVYAAAVIFPEGYHHAEITDSKKLTANKRERLVHDIERDALAWGIGVADAEEIDRINVLQASITAMHRALDALKLQPGFIMVDGNRFRGYRDIPHTCYIGGDALHLPISAASILAKVYRDHYMEKISAEYPSYGWISNKGYPTPAHIRAVRSLGLTPYHRKTFRTDHQLSMIFE
ncbi:MAG TPA: ribonuclease HII [Bacteroidales bacterium]|nr:ribonuclease HII [Bacteroidales bacterium]HRZ48572.1 ribonuclease HII [Bacteroidales bacterium]